MERAFKFEIGDVVRMKEGYAFEFSKMYKEHLSVYFRFWDGNCCCYVLNVGDDDICLISDEARLELEERPPMPPEEVQPECAKESHFLGSVFRINHRFVAAESLVAPTRNHQFHHLAGWRPRTDTERKGGITL